MLRKSRISCVFVRLFWNVSHGFNTVRVIGIILLIDWLIDHHPFTLLACDESMLMFSGISKCRAWASKTLSLSLSSPSTFCNISPWKFKMKRKQTPKRNLEKSRKILTSPKITKQFQCALTRGTCYSYSGGVWCNYCHPDPSACGRGVPCCSWWHWIRRIRRIRCWSQTIGFTRPNLYVSLKVDVFFQPMFSKRIAVSVQETMVFIEK